MIPAASGLLSLAGGLLMAACCRPLLLLFTQDEEMCIRDRSKPETKIRKVQRSTKVNALPRLLADVGEDAAVNVEDQAVGLFHTVQPV